MIRPTITPLNRQRIEEAMKKLTERLSESDQMVLVGVPKGAGVYEDGMTIATIAAVNEFGTADGHIPARPFLRPGVENRAEMYLRLVEKDLPDIVDGKYPMSRLMNRLGTLARDGVKQAINDTHTPENAESTIRQKGSDHPLIDTGIAGLLGAINYVVADKSDPLEEGL